MNATAILSLHPALRGFEGLLRLIDLTGPVEDETKRTLYELGQVRNVIVHRASIADRKLVKACPWLNLSPGTKVVVTSTAFARYVNAVQDYLVALLSRVKSRVPPRRSGESQGQPEQLQTE